METLFSISGKNLTDGNTEVLYNQAKIARDKAKADFERARQIVSEKIISIGEGMPEGVGTPTLAPQSSIMGEILLTGHPILTRIHMKPRNTFIITGTMRVTIPIHTAMEPNRGRNGIRTCILMILKSMNTDIILICITGISTINYSVSLIP